MCVQSLLVDEIGLAAMELPDRVLYLIIRGCRMLTLLYAQELRHALGAKAPPGHELL